MPYNYLSTFSIKVNKFLQMYAEICVWVKEHTGVSFAETYT